MAYSLSVMVSIVEVSARMGDPSRCATGLPRSTQPGHPSVGIFAIRRKMAVPTGTEKDHPCGLSDL